MNTLSELKPLINNWAKERDLLHPENSNKQRLKLIEECGELAGAILKNDIESQKDALGDIFIVLTILERQTRSIFEAKPTLYDISNHLALLQLINNPSVYAGHLFALASNLKLDLTDCANLAFNEIKDRKGKTVNGTFLRNK